MAVHIYLYYTTDPFKTNHPSTIHHSQEATISPSPEPTLHQWRSQATASNNRNVLTFSLVLRVGRADESWEISKKVLPLLPNPNEAFYTSPMTFQFHLLCVYLCLCYCLIPQCVTPQHWRLSSGMTGKHFNEWLLGNRRCWWNFDVFLAAEYWSKINSDHLDM
jgi:hypothetical protein